MPNTLRNDKTDTVVRLPNRAGAPRTAEENAARAAAAAARRTARERKAEDDARAAEEAAARVTATAAEAARLARAIVVQRAFGYAAGAVALILTAISVPDIANGLHTVTLADHTATMMLGIAIDGGMVVAELALIFAATEATADEIRRYATAYLATTLALSASMNAFAFSGSEVLVHRLFGIGLGMVIPFLTYALTRIAAKLIGGHTPK